MLRYCIIQIVILSELKFKNILVLAGFTSDKIVTGAHGMSVVADALFELTDFNGEYLLFLPGGMPGTLNLSKHEGLLALITAHAGKGKLIAAICAAPSVLGKLNLLEIFI